MTKLEQEIQEDFNLFYKDKAKYQEKVDGISDMLQLTGEEKLRSDFLPTYIVGNYEDKNPKYVLFSLNPGFYEYSNSEEEKLKNGTLDNYKNFVINFFKLVETFKYKDVDGKFKHFSSKHYTCIRPYIGTLINEKIDNKNQFDVYHRVLINIDLIPYHSTNISLSGNFSDEVRDYLMKRLSSILSFVRENKNCNGIIFNGAKYLELIKKLKPETKFKTVKINDFNNINLFTLEDVKCIQHSYLNRPNSHIKNSDKEKIAEEFLKYIES